MHDRLMYLRHVVGEEKWPATSISKWKGYDSMLLYIIGNYRMLNWCLNIIHISKRKYYYSLFQFFVLHMCPPTSTVSGPMNMCIVFVSLKYHLFYLNMGCGLWTAWAHCEHIRIAAIRTDMINFIESDWMNWRARVREPKKCEKESRRFIFISFQMPMVQTPKPHRCRLLFFSVHNKVDGMVCACAANPIQWHINV